MRLITGNKWLNLWFCNVFFRYINAIINMFLFYLLLSLTFDSSQFVSKNRIHTEAYSTLWKMLYCIVMQFFFLYFEKFKSNKKKRHQKFDSHFSSMCRKALGTISQNRQNKQFIFHIFIFRLIFEMGKPNYFKWINKLLVFVFVVYQTISVMMYK